VFTYFSHFVDYYYYQNNFIERNSHTSSKCVHSSAKQKCL